MGKIKHGHTSGGKISPTYSSWAGMIQRCSNKNCEEYRFYGAKGIVVFHRWLKFENFLKDMGEKPDGFTIDRIDPEGNYVPWNCRWILAKDNFERKGNYFDFKGERKTLTQISKELKLNRVTLYSRIKAGWDLDRAVNTPMRS